MGAARPRANPSGATASTNAASTNANAETSSNEDLELKYRTKKLEGKLQRSGFTLWPQFMGYACRPNKKCTQMSKICEVAASISL